MLLDFIGAFATGLGLLGLVMTINRLTGRWMARWAFPAAVGAGMIGFTVWSEYTWPSRTLDNQPQLRLASVGTEKMIFRPWSYLWPQVTRMITVDLSQTQVHPQLTDLVLTRLVLIARWQPVRAIPVVFDCTNHARVDLIEGVSLNEDGAPQGADWIPMEADDAVLTTACAVKEEIENGRGNGA